MDKEGKCLGHRAMPTTEEAFIALVKGYKAHGVRVAIESSGISWWIANVLRKAGADVHVVNPYQVKLIAHSRRKTDRYDSRVLAELLRCDGLPPRVYVPTVEEYSLRSVMKLRKQMVKLRAQVIVRAKAFVRGQGYAVEERSFYSVKSWEHMKEDHPEMGYYLEPLNKMFGCMNEEIKELEREGKKILPDKDETLRNLSTIPGISLLSGRVLMAAIGDIRRFKRSDQLVSYAGLNPSERSSGGVTRRGSISKQGRSEMREALVQGAWAVLRSPKPETELLKRFFYRIMHKRCSQVAITALARKLLVIAYQVMKSGKAFDTSLYMDKAAA